MSKNAAKEACAPSGLTVELARYIDGMDYNSLPEAVITKVKDLTLDQIGIQLACATLPWNKKVYEYVVEAGAKGESTVAYYGLRTNAEYASLANAVFGNGIDMDDYHPESMTHPTVTVVPPALAIGETTHASGREVILATALGTESAVRIGLATFPTHGADRGFHTMSTQGTFGSAVAAAKLLHLNLQNTTYALGIAGNECSGVTEYETEGGDVKRLFSGLGAIGGVRAALLAAKQFTAPATILEGNRGFLQAYGIKAKDLPKWKKITDGLGEKYEVLDTRIKLHDVPGSQHGVIDAVRSILKEHPMTPDEIEEIIVGYSHHSLTHSGSSGPEPKDMVSAQFNAYFTAALAVVKGSNDLNTYIDAMNRGFKEPAVLAISHRTRLVWDEESEEAFQKTGEFLGKVTIRTKDGRSYSARNYPKGSPQNRVTRGEVRDKFMRLAVPVLSKKKAEHIYSVVEKLDEMEDIRQLTELLVVKKD